jgi:hypothetical protein
MIIRLERDDILEELRFAAWRSQEREVELTAIDVNACYHTR